jgi:hypothetical protein
MHYSDAERPSAAYNNPAIVSDFVCDARTQQAYHLAILAACISTNPEADDGDPPSYCRR